MLSDLFRKLRRSEPEKIWYLRRLVITVSLTLLFIILVVLSMGIQDELPSIKTTFEKVDDLSAPEIAFFWDKNFTISCQVYDTSNSIILDVAGCNRYIPQPRYIDSGSYKYLAQFSPQGNLNFSTRGVSAISIYLGTVGSSFDDFSIQMIAQDPRYNISTLDVIESDPFVEETYYKNEYLLTNPTNRSLYLWRFSKHIRKTMVKDALSYIGFRPTYIERPYIESNIQFIPFTGNQSSFNFIQLNILPQNFIVTEETEQRSKTIGTVIGTIGGVWSTILSFYVFLFGSDLVSSWGLMQKLLKSHPKVEENFELDGGNEKYYEKDSEKYDEKDDLKRLILKLEEHRKFYEEYVIAIPSETTRKL